MRQILSILYIFAIFLSACSIDTKPEEAKSVPIQQFEQQEKAFKQALRNYVNDNFGMEGLETSWYPSIKSYNVKMSGEKSSIYVIVTPETNKKALAAISVAVWSFVNDKTQQLFKADHLIIKNVKGKVLVDKANPLN